MSGIAVAWTRVAYQQRPIAGAMRSHAGRSFSRPRRIEPASGRQDQFRLQSGIANRRYHLHILSGIAFNGCIDGERLGAKYLVGRVLASIPLRRPAHGDHSATNRVQPREGRSDGTIGEPFAGPQWREVSGPFRRLARSNRYCSGTGRRTRLQVAPRSDPTTRRQAQRRSLDCSQMPRRRQPLHGRRDLRARDVAQQPHRLPDRRRGDGGVDRPLSRFTARTSPALPFWSSRNGYLWGDAE
jgi:hypothetical protein